MIDKINLSSQKKYELIDITEEVQKFAEKMDNGLLVLFAPHATGAIVICENEPGLKEDLIEFLKDLFEKKGYKHDEIDDNAHAHIISSLIGCERTVLVEKGKLVLGTWQSIFFLEPDGPRERTVYVRAI